MLYYLFQYLHETFSWPGTGVFRYISFRAGAAAVLSLFISIVLGRWLIRFFQRRAIIEGTRVLGVEGEAQKAQTPTMGGLVMMAAIVVPTLLLGQLTNVYLRLLLATTLWLGMVGFIDDYIKVFHGNKDGLSEKVKLVGQTLFGLGVGATLYFHPQVVVREFTAPPAVTSTAQMPAHKDVKSTKTTIPFFKNNELDYTEVIHKVLPFVPLRYAWVIYLLLVAFIIAGTSNGVNLTDGIDGLAAGSSAIVALVLALLAYVSGSVIFSRYLNIMYIPGSGELAVFCAAFVGACIGFLWYNAYPAQIFMGDTGSLMLGGIIAVLSLVTRKELLLPLLGGIFFVEVLSVMLQISYFRYTKRRYGRGRRIFKMSPLHHHFQKMGLHEAKIVTRFLIVGVVLAILTLVTLKLR